MDCVQNYRSYNSNIKSHSPNFKAYNLETVKKGLERGKVPASEVIEEMKRDRDALSKSDKLKDMSKCAGIDYALWVISKINLSTLKSELEIKKSLLKAKLQTATPEEKESIWSDLEDCIMSIHEINRKLGIKK